MNDLILGGGPKQSDVPPTENRGRGGKAATKADPATAAGVTWAKVTKGGDVSHGRGISKVPTGEVISSGSYDFEKLRNSGLELQPCDPPAWFIAAQG